MERDVVPKVPDIERVEEAEKAEEADLCGIWRTMPVEYLAQESRQPSTKKLTANQRVLLAQPP